MVLAAALTAAALLAGAARASTIVAHWAMDESGGTTMTDDSGSGNTGTTTNIAFGQPGFQGSAYGFDGRTSYVTIPDSPTLDPGASDFSFTVHVNFPNVPATDFDLLRKGLAGTNGGDYKLEILKKQSGSVAIAACDWIGSQGSSGVNWSQDLHGTGWHTITCTKTASQIAITVDGQTKTKSVTIGSIANSSPLWLGAKLKGTSPKDQYLGLMDEVTIQVG